MAAPAEEALEALSGRTTVKTMLRVVGDVVQNRRMVRARPTKL